MPAREGRRGRTGIDRRRLPLGGVTYPHVEVVGHRRRPVVPHPPPAVQRSELRLGFEQEEPLATAPVDDLPVGQEGERDDHRPATPAGGGGGGGGGGAAIVVRRRRRRDDRRGRRMRRQEEEGTGRQGGSDGERRSTVRGDDGRITHV